MGANVCLQQVNCRTKVKMSLHLYSKITRGVETMSLMLAFCLGVNFTLKTINE